jgi:hypothetical protein
VVATIILLGRRVVDPVAPDPKRPFDAMGAVLSGVGMFCMVFGILQADTNTTLFIVFLAIGLAFLAGFFVYIRSRERGGKDALLSLDLFRNRTSNLGMITQNLQWLLLMGVSFVVSVFLQTQRHYSAIKTGVIFTAATLGVLVSSLAAERLAQRRQQKTLIASGFVMTAAGIGLLLGPGPRRVVEPLVVRPRAAADRARPGRDADPFGQHRAGRLPGGQAGRDLRAVAQHLQPRLVVRHRDRRHVPGLKPRLGQRDIRGRDDRPRRLRDRRSRYLAAPAGQSVAEDGCGVRP